MALSAMASKTGRTSVWRLADHSENLGGRRLPVERFR